MSITGLDSKNYKFSVSLGDPAGIGVDIAIMESCKSAPASASLIHFADPVVIAERSLDLGLEVEIVEISNISGLPKPKEKQMIVWPIYCDEKVKKGVGNHRHSNYVLRCLNTALSFTKKGKTDALITGPVNKGLINKAGISFSGHTEYIAESLNVKRPVMLLASPSLKVALVTTHVPLSNVPGLITVEDLIDVGKIVNDDFIKKFNIQSPKIYVCGLNPHAGDNGYLGENEKTIISPAIQILKEKKINVKGPLAADTAFSVENREKCDVIIAMYHDQGLAPLKAISFGDAVNITLGLPIIRVSVDHGTAFDKAGKGTANSSSLRHAIRTAIEILNGKS